jgi:superfamily II DNA/RNA helicase
VDVLVRSLKQHSFNAAALHGDMVQFKRMETLDSFKKGQVDILVASDVAARGLDIVTVSHVFNFDVPLHPDDYVHRIGRTGRAGRSGRAFTLVTEDDFKLISAIERLTDREIPELLLSVSNQLDEKPEPEAPKDLDRRRRSRRRVETDDGPHPPKRRERNAGRTAEPEARPNARRDLPRRGRSDFTEERGRRSPWVEHPADIPGPQSFGKDNTPAFLLRPVRQAVGG